MAETQRRRPRKLAAPPLRPEYLRDTVAGADIGVVQKPLTMWQRLANQAWLRKAFILVVIAAAWELYARQLNNPLLVPTFTATVRGVPGRHRQRRHSAKGVELGACCC